jgi:hypothetical protein
MQLSGWSICRRVFWTWTCGISNEGEKKGHWSYKSEEKKDELVQKNTTSKIESEATPPVPKSDDGKNTGGESVKTK